MAAIIVTYNRFSVLEECLRTVRAQTRQPDFLLVIDNDSPDGTASKFAELYPDIQLIRLDTNRGVGAGIAAGMEYAKRWQPDMYWLVEDDSLYASDYLALASDAMKSDKRIAMLGNGGWRWRAGLWKGVPTPSSVGPVPRDLVILDGALVSCDAVEACGVPLSEYFMMIQDIEYPLRLRENGYEGFVWSALRVESRKLGATAPLGASTYRAYYQVRNHLDLVINRRSPLMAIRFLQRLAGLFFSDINSGHFAGRSQMRIAGVADGLRGRMGVTVRPGAQRPVAFWKG